MELKERIRSLINYSGLSIPKFAALAGFKTPQAVRELLYGRTKTLSYSAQYKIISSFPEVNSDWLVNGKGDMIKAGASKSKHINIRNDHIKNSSIYGYVNIAIPEKGKKKILNSDGITVEVDDTAGITSEQFAAIITSKDEQISRLLTMIEEQTKTIAKLMQDDK